MLVPRRGDNSCERRRVEVIPRANGQRRHGVDPEHLAELAARERQAAHLDHPAARRRRRRTR